MKNVLFLAAAFAAVISLHAQSSDYAYVFNPKNFKANIIEAMAKTDVAASSDINAKTLKNFAKDFRGATNAEWFQLKNNETMCRFSENGISNWAFYKPNGSILANMKGYQEAQLPKDVRKTVKSTYYDYTVTYVQEIDLAGEQPVYIVHLEDENMIKILRVRDDEIDVIRELSKK